MFILYGRIGNASAFANLGSTLKRWFSYVRDSYPPLRIYRPLAQPHSRITTNYAVGSQPLPNLLKPLQNGLASTRFDLIML